MPTTTALRYPQMPPLADEELESFLRAMPVARLATHNTDGTIHLVPVSCKYVDGDILIGTQAVSRKVKNIQADPNVTVLLDDPGMPFPRGVMIYGTASLDTDDLLGKRVEILEGVMPHEAAEGLVAGLAAAYEPAVIRIKPTKFVSWDYSKPGFMG